MAKDLLAWATAIAAIAAPAHSRTYTVTQITDDGYKDSVPQINNKGNSVVEHYITNFKTAKVPAEYTVEVWRQTQNFLIGQFSFETVGK